MICSLALSIACLSVFQNILGEPFLFQDPAKVLLQSERKHHHHRRPLKSEKTIADCIREDDRFSKLAELLEEQSHLNDELDDPGNKLTFFAPTNEVILNSDTYSVKTQNTQSKLKIPQKGL